MGNDGGSIPKRRELVKEAAREKTTTEAKETLLEQQEYCWTTCPLSQQPLKEPVVSDWGGNLYNKDAVIEFLLPAEDEAAESARLEKAKLIDGRIKGLRDVQEVHFYEDRSNGANTRAAAHFERRWSCPITSKTLGPGVKAVYLVPCGHAFEDSAIKNTTEGRCLQCEEPFETDNVIQILPLAAAERERLVARSQRLKGQGLSHSLKKLSGKKRKKGTTDMVATRSGDVAGGASEAKARSTRPAENLAQSIKNSSTASLAAKVKAELEQKSKRRKVDENLQGLYSKKQKGTAGNSDFMTRGFTMSTNPK